MDRKRACAAAVAVVLAFVAGAAALALRPPQNAPEIGDVEWLTDHGATPLGPAELAALPAARFQPLTGYVHAGFTPGPRWIRVHVGPTRSSLPRAIVFPYPLAEHVDVFVPQPSGGFERLAGGLAVERDASGVALEGGVHVARVTLPPGGERALLVRVETRGPVFLAVAILPLSELPSEVRVVAALAAGFGSLVVLVLLALALAIAARVRTAAQLATFIGGQTAYLALVTGVIPMVVPLGGRAALALQAAFAAVVIGAGCGFGRSFFRPVERARPLDLLLRALPGCAILAAAAAPWAPALAMRAIAWISLAAIGAGLAAAPLGSGPRQRAVWPVLPGLVLFEAASAAHLLAMLGVLPPTPLGVVVLLLASIVGTASAGVGVVLEVALEADARERLLGRMVEQRTLESAQARDALRASEARFRLAFKTSPIPMTLTRLDDGVFVAVNDAFERMHGLAASEAVGRAGATLGLWRDPAERAAIVNDVRQAGLVHRREVRLRTPRGERIILYSAARIDVDGVPHMMSVSHDVTEERAAAAERNAMEQELRQAQKLDALGRLAAGVAHDFNNLLTVVTVNLALAVDGLAEDAPDRALLEEARGATERASALTKQLLAFGRRAPAAPRPVSIGAVLDALAPLLRRLVHDGVRLDVGVAPGLPAVRVDPSALEQVVVNLVVNASDALPAGGSVAVEADAVDVPPRDGRPGGRHVRIAVRDDGAGMSPEVQARIFEPFFTTKEQGRGTGLGLATVYGVVQRHGGFVVVHSEPGRGASFEVHLPADAGAAVAVEAPVAAVPATGDETVLVVDDTARVLDASCAALRRLGYRVLAASGGAEALALAARHDGPIHLLLTDVRMPDMDGLELAERLARVRPATRAMFMTGHGGTHLEAGRLDDRDVVEKPFTVDELAARVREALARPRASDARGVA